MAKNYVNILAEAAEDGLSLSPNVTSLTWVEPNTKRF